MFVELFVLSSSEAGKIVMHPSMSSPNGGGREGGDLDIF